jgi:hypothetical protein
LEEREDDRMEGGKRKAGGREEESWRAGRGDLEGGKIRARLEGWKRRAAG